MSFTTFVSDYSAVSREDDAPSSGEFDLAPNYPNPFRSESTIEFTLPISSDVTLEVYDLLGRTVTTLVHGMATPGSHRVTFDASGWPAGVYFYRLQADGLMLTRRMALVR